MDNLTLFFIPSCPYCHKVLKFIKDKGIQILLKDRNARPEYRQELIRIGGSPQVPCLIIDGKALYESDAIIEWLDEHLVKRIS